MDALPRWKELNLIQLFPQPASPSCVPQLYFRPVKLRDGRKVTRQLKARFGSTRRKSKEVFRTLLLLNLFAHSTLI